ncbi:MAG: ABC transporter permease [Armatimonadota bacterium]|nr:ABC transporter permease [Armatimonadota bacterium]MDR7450706.1 ABC transporter permease [Armatimonadota bacterium]MDR7466062.1 ABC transporter permease [Armatimonadota bacterium]MDR7493901.1 ABC transporter permease [Armatimonadota bacterium]MDR7504006.1 ABC transporter permease [Armatimonadota bacterium]
MSDAERALTLPPRWAQAAATWREALQTLVIVARRDRFALAGLLVYLVFLMVALLAPALAPYDPLALNYLPDGEVAANLPPSPAHPLGTTNLGRDIFSQLLYGARAALIVGFVAALGVVILGTVVGLVAGYYGGWIDALLMRAADVAFGIPFLPMAIVLVAFLGPSLWNVVLVMVLLLWRDTGRIIRAQVLTLRERSYVESARVLGAGHARTMFVHIAPNVLPLSFLYGSLAIGWAILTEASISFLGFGDPNVISWGFMLQDAYNSQALARQAFHWFVPPGVCIMLTVMAGFFISRGYEELLFPRLRRR